MDIDPNYDPSDFLKLASSIKVEQPDNDHLQQHQEQELDHVQYEQHEDDQMIMVQQQQQQQFQQEELYQQYEQEQQHMQYDPNQQQHQLQQMEHDPNQQDLMHMSDGMMYQSMDNVQHEVSSMRFGVSIQPNIRFCFRILVWALMTIWLFRTVKMRPNPIMLKSSRSRKPILRSRTIMMKMEAAFGFNAPVCHNRFEVYLKRFVLLNQSEIKNATAFICVTCLFLFL